MKFDLVDQILDHNDTQLSAVKNVTSAEEYLQDHFPTFPILPGVMMLECLVQTARKLMEKRGEIGPWVLGEARNTKYGNMVRPGEKLQMSVSLFKIVEAGEVYTFKGEGRVNGNVAIAGRFTLRRVRENRPEE